MAENDELRSTPYWNVETDSWGPGGDSPGGFTPPVEWTVGDDGSLLIDLTLEADGSEHQAFGVNINGSNVLRVYLATDGTPLIDIADVNVHAIWRSEVDDAHPTLAILGDGQIRSQDLPTADPHVSGQFWNDAGTMKISAG